MAFCSNCGEKLKDGAKFCHGCGVLVGVSVEGENHRKQIYEGELHKCPNCGELLKAFLSVCPSCNYEIRGAKITSRVNELSLKLEKTESIEKKIEYISNFYIPNTKEDIYEFFILATSNMHAGGYGIDAWSAKLEQAYQKARLAFGNTPDFEYLKQLYNKANKKKVLRSIGKTIKDSKSLQCIILSVVGILMIVIGFLAGSATNDSDSPFYMVAMLGMFPLMGAFYGLILSSNKKEVN